MQAMYSPDSWWEKIALILMGKYIKKEGGRQYDEDEQPQ